MKAESGAGRFVSGLREARGFRLLFLAIFVLFLAVALLARATGRPWQRWLPAAGTATGVLAGVSAAVSGVMPFLVEREGPVAAETRSTRLGSGAMRPAASRWSGGEPAGGVAWK